MNDGSPNLSGQPILWQTYLEGRGAAQGRCRQPATATTSINLTVRVLNTLRVDRPMLVLCHKVRVNCMYRTNCISTTHCILLDV